MRLGRSVAAPPHADWGYECLESDLRSAMPSEPTRVKKLPAFQESVTAPWNMFPTCRGKGKPTSPIFFFSFESSKRSNLDQKDTYRT